MNICWLTQNAYAYGGKVISDADQLINNKTNIPLGDIIGISEAVH